MNHRNIPMNGDNGEWAAIYNRMDENKYPLEPPYDDELVFGQNAIVRLNPQGLQKKAKICPVCSYPIHIRMVSQPCQHYFCYECYQKSPFTCGYCGSLNSRIQRLPDSQGIFTCDLYCSKAFASEEQLFDHMKNHQLLLKQ